MATSQRRMPPTLAVRLLFWLAELGRELREHCDDVDQAGSKTCPLLSSSK
jgi:hypothetical protein